MPLVTPQSQTADLPSMDPPCHRFGILKQRAGSPVEGEHPKSYAARPAEPRPEPWETGLVRINWGGLARHGRRGGSEVVMGARSWRLKGKRKQIPMRRMESSRSTRHKPQSPSSRLHR